MTASTMADGPAHRNNIGVLRIVLASAVILSHSVEFTNGSRDHEPLTRLFHTVSLGDAAVTGFFILSGYLISRSYRRTSSPGEYLLHRIARIYPAFLVSYLVAILIEAPMVGLSPWPSLLHLLGDSVLLREPVVDGLHLNTPAWTIAFEFRCYLLTLVLGRLGVLRHRRLVLALTVAVTAGAFLTITHQDWWRLAQLQRLPWWDIGIGEIRRVFQFGSAYLVGTCVLLYWDLIGPRLTGIAALAGFAAALALMNVGVSFAYLGLSTFGAVPLFWLAMRARLGPLQRINDRWDISYGTYLYGWIVQTLLMTAMPWLSASGLTLLAVPLSWGAGAASWFLIERRSKDWFRRRLPTSAERATVSAINP